MYEVCGNIFNTLCLSLAIVLQYFGLGGDIIVYLKPRLHSIGSERSVRPLGAHTIARDYILFSLAASRRRQFGV